MWVHTGSKQELRGQHKNKDHPIISSHHEHEGLQAVTTEMQTHQNCKGNVDALPNTHDERGEELW